VKLDLVPKTWTVHWVQSNSRLQIPNQKRQQLVIRHLFSFTGRKTLYTQQNNMKSVTVDYKITINTNVNLSEDKRSYYSRTGQFYSTISHDSFWHCGLQHEFFCLFSHLKVQRKFMIPETERTGSQVCRYEWLVKCAKSRCDVCLYAVSRTVSFYRLCHAAGIL